MHAIRLKAGREKSLLRRHPWVFSGAITEVRGAPGDGETVRVVNTHGEFLAWGAFSPQSQIRVRAWSWDAGEKIDRVFFRARLSAAITARRALLSERHTNACRLVHGESDGFPGLIVDRYAETLVAQYLSSGAERWREDIADLLVELTGIATVYERSDAEVRRLEGLPERRGPLRGPTPPEKVQIIENGLKFWVDVQGGHKTGFYLDQRENRYRVRQLARGRRVLDCFCYSGGFTVNALAGEAQAVLAIDSSAEAFALGSENLALNGLSNQPLEWWVTDVFQALRGLRDQGRRFDLIVLDPPKFAPTAAHAEAAARAYKDINLLAFKLMEEGGLLVTFSCSGGIGADLFQKIVAGAALDAGVQAQIVERLSQGPDHPVGLNFPEGEYLKGLVVRVCAS